MEDADFAEEEPEDEAYFRLGEQDEQFRDYASLALKDDHVNRCAAGSYLTSSTSALFGWQPCAQCVAKCCHGSPSSQRPLSGYLTEQAEVCTLQQAPVGLPGRPHLPGDIFAAVQAGIRLPHRYRRTSKPALQPALIYASDLVTLSLDYRSLVLRALQPDHGPWRATSVMLFEVASMRLYPKCWRHLHVKLDQR